MISNQDFDLRIGIFHFTECEEHFKKYAYVSSKCDFLGLPCGSVVRNLPANAGDMGSIPDLGRSHMPRSN